MIRESHGILLLTFALMATGCGAAGEYWPEPPVLDAGRFAAPALEDRPWVRTWWPGGDVAQAEVAAELAALRAAGFGGVELQPFDAALDPNLPAEARARCLSYDTPEFHQRLHEALQSARDLGLQVDLTLGSGWPAAGTHIPPADSLRALMWNEWSFEGPTLAELPTLAPACKGFCEVAILAEDLVGERLTRFLPEQAHLVAVLAARVRSGQRSASPLDLKDTVELSASSLLELTDRVEPDGSLRWEVPEGRWQVVAFFDVPDGQLPQLVAQAGDGFVLDHFRSAQVQALLERYAGAGAGLESFHGQPLRAVFTDSFELKTDRHFCADFPAEFRGRRGYELLPWLPAVLFPGTDNYIYEVGRLDRAAEFALGPEDERVRYDYARTVSDLFIERFLDAAEEWAGARGLVTRVQNHGMEIDLIAAAAAVTIPETEQLYAGGSDLFLRLAASGAALAGRRLVSAEAGVSPGRDHMTTPAKLRALCDKALGSGVNQLVLHGFPYRADGAYGDGGWFPFSSPHGGTNTYAIHLGQESYLWPYLPPLAAYFARAQALLRQGKPEVDVLVLYPWMGFPSSLALEPGYREPLLGGYLDGLEPELREMPFAVLAELFGPPVTAARTDWLLQLAPVLAALEAAGHTWAWIHPAGLSDARVQDGRLRAGDTSAGSLLVFRLPHLEPAAAERLRKLAGDGGMMVFAGPASTRQPGYLDFERGDQRVTEALQGALAGRRVRSADEAVQVVAALAEADAGPRVGIHSTDDSPSTLRLWRRRLSRNGFLTLIRNPVREPATARLTVSGGCPDARFWDAWTGEVSRATFDLDGSIPLRLAGLESIFLVCDDGPEPPGTQDQPAWARRLGREAVPIPLTAWHLAVEGADVEGGRFEAELEPLRDWRDIPALAGAASLGAYTTELTLGEVDEDTRVELDLGWVQGVARVRVNGQEAGELLVSPFRLDISSLIRPGANDLRVEVEGPWRNRLIARAEAGDPLAAQFAGKSATRIAMGLLGPAGLRCQGAGCPEP